MRILVYGEAKYTFPVRVGRYEKRYLAMAGREVSIRTPIGEGEIVRIARDPLFINPVDNKRYYGTTRDDKVRTELPLIPWLEPSIDGRRQGSLIHPTTNEATLGKPYSNGCVGTPEGAGWLVYYYAPLGTKVNFRYDLKVLDENGDTILLNDLSQLQKP
jgi:L,D-transpeptidase ErfK/SrfK